MTPLTTHFRRIRVVRAEQPTDVAVTCWNGHGDDTFVIVHGLGMSKDAYPTLVGRLRAQGRVIGVDLPGFGSSPRPGGEWSIDDLALAVVEVLDQLDVRGARIIGHSMGCQVAVEVALRASERVSDITLVAPTLDPRTRSEFAVIGRFIADSIDLNPLVVWRGLRQYVRTDTLWLARKLDVMREHDMIGRFAELTCPVLILRGEDDKVVTAPWCEQLADAASAPVRVLTVKGRGHETMLDGAQDVARAVLGDAAPA